MIVGGGGWGLQKLAFRNSPKLKGKAFRLLGDLKYLDVLCVSDTRYSRGCAIPAFFRHRRSQWRVSCGKNGGPPRGDTVTVPITAPIAAVFDVLRATTRESCGPLRKMAPRPRLCPAAEPVVVASGIGEWRPVREGLPIRRRPWSRANPRCRRGSWRPNCCRAVRRPGSRCRWFR